MSRAGQVKLWPGHRAWWSGDQRARRPPLDVPERYAGVQGGRYKGVTHTRTRGFAMSDRGKIQGRHGCDGRTGIEDLCQWPPSLDLSAHRSPSSLVAERLVGLSLPGWRGVIYRHGGLDRW